MKVTVISLLARISVLSDYSCVCIIRRESHRCRLAEQCYLCVTPYGMWLPVAVRWFPRTTILAYFTLLTLY